MANQSESVIQDRIATSDGDQLETAGQAILNHRCLAAGPGAEVYVEFVRLRPCASMAEERVNRKLVAILAADVVGYPRLMGADEEGTLAALKQHRQAIFDPAVAAHNGRIVKLIGGHGDDGVDAAYLMPFPTKGSEALLERLDEICQIHPLDII